MRTLKEIITKRSNEAKLAIAVPTLVLGLCLAPLLIPNEYKFPRNTNGSCAGWKWPTKEDDKKLYKSIKQDEDNKDTHNYEF